MLDAIDALPDQADVRTANEKEVAIVASGMGAREATVNKFLGIAKHQQLYSSTSNTQ